MEQSSISYQKEEKDDDSSLMTEAFDFGKSEDYIFENTQNQFNNIRLQVAMSKIEVKIKCI